MVGKLSCCVENQADVHCQIIVDIVTQVCCGRQICVLPTLVFCVNFDLAKKGLKKASDE